MSYVSIIYMHVYCFSVYILVAQRINKAWNFSNVLPVHQKVFYIPYMKIISILLWLLLNLQSGYIKVGSYLLIFCHLISDVK